MRTATTLSVLALAATGFTATAPSAEAASGSACGAWADTGLAGVKGRICWSWTSSTFSAKTQAYNSAGVTRYLKGQITMTVGTRKQWDGSTPQYTVPVGQVVTLASTTLYESPAPTSCILQGKVIKSATGATQWTQTRTVGC
ncbi:hypothetical protein ACOACQ_16725 [Nocardioides sp. CPCC 206347]|uniref:hypothetical protein n=1 Tax=Nocardioides sp. CPCC 206347 TaxID=3406463 RepID=UPI003B43BFB1